MPDIEIVEILQDIQQKVTEVQVQNSEIKGSVALLGNKFENVEKQVNKHEKCLYGDQEKMGKGGLIDGVREANTKAEGVGKRLDGISRTGLMVWTGIFSVIQIALAGLWSFFLGRHKAG